MRLKDPQIPLCQLAGMIEDDLRQRSGTYLQKPHIPAIADIVASAIETKSVNTCVWKYALPRQHCTEISREKFIRRVMSNPLIEPEFVMQSYGCELIESIGCTGETVILMLDQSKLVDGFECLMLSIRVGDRALPWLWQVVETGGAIGFTEQKKLLDVANAALSQKINVLLMGDRFYGTIALIDWCQQAKWSYRLRLKRNIHLEHEGGLLITGELLAQKFPFVENAKMGEVVTNIGVIHDKGHDEPWIIAMDCKPSRERVLDYGLRWSIECLFSDMKSRGFDIESSQFRHADRLARLLMIVSIAMYWCVSRGAEAEASEESRIKKEVVAHGLQEG